MANVMVPQREKKDGVGQALQVASFVPGPVGQIAGGVSAAKGFTDKKASDVAPVESGAKAALQRRAASLQPLNPADYGSTLAAAEQAAATLPPDLQQQYLPALQAARAKSQGVA